VDIEDRWGLSLVMEHVVTPADTGGSTGGDSAVDFEEFYCREFTRFVALAAALTGSRSGAEDIVQDAMLDAHRRWERIGRYESPGGWLRRVMVQRSAKVHRKRSNEHRAHERAVQVEGRCRVQEPVDPVLLQALRTLPARQRAVVALHYLEDLSVVDTADLLDLSPSTVTTHLARARRALLSALTSQQDQEADHG